VPVSVIEIVVEEPVHIGLPPVTFAVATGVVVTTRVAIESQPPALCNVVVYVPGEEMVMPFH